MEGERLGVMTGNATGAAEMLRGRFSGVLEPRGRTSSLVRWSAWQGDVVLRGSRGGER